ncbi:MAG: DUF58 domain-containing protein [Bacteroidota bacterium]|nr:DUF58 domain-containing protein [Bacteroidota bacterium]
MKKLFKSFYISKRFYLVASGFAGLFIASFFFSALFPFAMSLLILWAALFMTDLLMLYRSGGKILTANRQVPERLSNGDRNIIKLELTNKYPFTATVSIIDEIPFQFQERHFLIERKIASGEAKNIQYQLRPVERGEYHFGSLNIYVSNFIGFIQRRFIFSSDKFVPVYPSFLQMRKYELMAISDRITEAGAKKIRKISNNKEFEQIKEYVQGDDYRTINWKATARRSKLMVNQYQDEKAQHIYNVIDMGRSMKMPFNKMSLFEYAINSALAVSDVSLLKDDKAGLITFSDKIHRVIKADRKLVQMKLITEALYKETTNSQEPDYEALYYRIRSVTTQRSLLIFYTNIESIKSEKRQMKALKLLAKHHIVLVVFFKNTEIEEMIQRPTENTQEIYFKVIGEKLIYEKRELMKRLNKSGIHSIFTAPENLTVTTINAYLKLKSEGLI